MQLFEHQELEDGDITTRVWTADRSPPPENEDDPDDDDNIPIPRIKPKGKDSDNSSAIENSDEENDDYYVLDPLDPTPISWAPASVPARHGMDNT